MTISKLVSRRLLLSTAAAIGSGTTFVGLVHAQAAPAAAPGAAALAKLRNLDVSVASAPTVHLAAAKAAGAESCAQGLVRRVVMPLSSVIRNTRILCRRQPRSARVSRARIGPSGDRGDCELSGTSSLSSG